MQSIIRPQPVHLVQFMLSGLLLVTLVLLPLLFGLLCESRRRCTHPHSTTALSSRPWLPLLLDK